MSEEKKKVSEKDLGTLNGGYLSSEAAGWLDSWRSKILLGAKEKNMHKQAARLMTTIECSDREYSVEELKRVFRRFCDTSHFD